LANLAGGATQYALKATMTASQSKNPKRFYAAAAVAPLENGSLGVQLDGKPIKTPAGRALAVPSAALAEAIAGEWNAQGDEIVPATLPLTRLANSAIDGVAERRGEVVEDIVNYAASDLLCYRAEAPAELAAKQARLWDPILAWVRAEYDASFNAGTGVKHLHQPASSLDAIRRALSALNPFKLAALHVMTTLTGSALIALAHANRFLEIDAAWEAAHVDENWQVSLWGEDFEAAQRQEKRFSEFLNASRFFDLA
jgi:chaperone required for assembly of F1-ATPase